MPATRRLLPAVSAAAILATGVSAANAVAATIAVPVSCVVTTVGFSDPVLPIVGSGFTPGSFVTFSTATKSKPTPSFLTSAQADGAGNIRTVARRAQFNSSKTNDQSFSLIASQGGSPLAATAFRQVQGGFTYNFRSGASPRQKVRYTGRGWVPGKNVYIHFRFGGKTKKTVKIGKAASPCGVVSRRMRALPLATLRVGTYRFYVDQSRKYSKNTSPQSQPGGIRVYTVFR